MKIRVQRIECKTNHNPYDIDDHLVEAIIKGGIRPGKALCIQLFPLDLGVWRTTKIIQVEYKDETVTIFRTKNSLYMVRKGWEN